jgi:pyruvate dehydrogenase E1 component
VRTSRPVSTQDAFGKILVDLSRAEEVAPYLVTTAPDVATSTNLAGFINRKGVFAPAEQRAWSVDPLLKWTEGPSGQHIELGISEMNLFMLLGQLGLSHEINGELLVPIGTVYDPFVCRGLDALIYGTYSGSKFIVAGTPAGVSLSPEGGAHQSAITASIGLELPGTRAYEPCYARETEWCLLEGIRQCLDRENGSSTYLRLSTKPVDQTPFEAALERIGEAELRRQVLLGGYRLLEPAAGDGPRVVIAAAGAIVPDALDAACELSDEGVGVTLVNVTSADALYHAWQDSNLAGVRASRMTPSNGHLEDLIRPDERRLPLVTVLDGASHMLAFLGSVFGQPTVALGVDRFGQSGARADLYAYEGIDSAHIFNAALAAIARGERA